MTKILFIVGAIANAISLVLITMSSTGSLQDIATIIAFLVNIAVFIRLIFLKDNSNYDLIKKLDKRVSALDNQPRITVDEKTINSVNEDDEVKFL